MDFMEQASWNWDEQNVESKLFFVEEEDEEKNEINDVGDDGTLHLLEIKILHHHQVYYYQAHLQENIER